MIKSLNFDFLVEHDSRLAKLGSEAENFLYQQKYEATMRTLRNFAERLALIVAEKEQIEVYEYQQFSNLVKRLTEAGIIKPVPRFWFDRIRTIANNPENLIAHERIQIQGSSTINPETVERNLRFALKLGEWFHQRYGIDYNFEQKSFKSPLDLNLKFDELSKNQYKYTAQSLPYHKFWMIRGISGSGKTYIAIQEAKRLSKENKKVLLLVFNELIGDDLREQLKGVATVKNYHGFCHDIFRSVNYNWNAPTDTKSPNYRQRLHHFCSIDVPKLLLKALEKIRIEQIAFDYFDVIIVDEGQDFCPWWWEGIVKFAINATPTYFYFIYDPEQNYQNTNIQNSVDELKKIIEQKTSQEFKELTLYKNFRNSKEIASKLFEMFGVNVVLESAIEDLPNIGQEPEEECFSNPISERKWIQGKIEYLINRQGIKNHQISIISLQHFNLSIFAENCQLGNFKVVNIQRGDERKIQFSNSNNIQFYEAQRVKGLEFDYVFISGFFEITKLKNLPKFLLLLYLSASRAKKGLYIAYRSRKYD